MKILAFIKWHYNKLDIWEKIWYFSVACFGWWLAAPKDSDSERIAQVLGALSFLVVFSKWFIYDTVKYSYEKFLKERQDLFDTIKHSDSK